MHFCFIVQNEEKAFAKVVLFMSKLFLTVVFFFIWLSLCWRFVHEERNCRIVNWVSWEAMLCLTKKTGKKIVPSAGGLSAPLINLG
jgi:hypothetical protein